MAAQTLPDAFNALDPLRPVTPAQVGALFVSRPRSPVVKMKTHLQVSQRPSKLLFVGHRGAGKSSEMAYLSALLEDSFITIFTPLYDAYKTPFVTHTELIFAVYLSLLKWATNKGLADRGIVTQGWEALLEHIYEPLHRRLFGENIPSPVNPDVGITVRLNVLVTELEVKIGAESYTRNRIRELYDGRIAELLEHIQELSQLLEEKLKRRILLVVEDLDKLDL